MSDDDLRDDDVADDGMDGGAEGYSEAHEAALAEAQAERLTRQAYLHGVDRQLFRFLFANCCFFAAALVSWEAAAPGGSNSADMVSGLDTVRGALLLAFSVYGFWTCFLNIFHGQMKVWPFLLSALVAAEAERRGHGASALSSLVLRAMRPARYSERNLGHAGLASLAYAHFTSPIRRYPDLIAHRALLSAVDAGEERPNPDEVAGAALHCSDRERDSMKVERAADDVCAAFLLERELYEEGQQKVFAGEVSGVIPPGVFVTFEGSRSDVYEGFFPARRMPGDRYEINDVESALIGVRTGKRVGYGDPIEIRVDSIEAPRGRVDLSSGEKREERGRGTRGGAPSRGRGSGSGGRGGSGGGAKRKGSRR